MKSKSARELARACSHKELANVGRIVILAKQEDSPWGRAVFEEMQQRIDAAEAAAAEPLQVTIVDLGYKSSGV